MAWVQPRFSRGQVDAAGVYLATKVFAAIESGDEAAIEELDQTFAIIDNWRMSHAYPLQVLKMTLKGRAKSIDNGCIVAQRLKRLTSIWLKLRLNPDMNLSRMHDIGGCRAVMRSIAEVRELIELYFESKAKNPHDRPEFVRVYDYIEKPKKSGYRGVHLVYKYRTASKHRIYNGHRIEIQIRSRLQHVWATAVEVAGTFTGQALKSNVGDVAWRRFFALMGSALARRERSPLVPETPADLPALKAEVLDLSERLRIVQSFQGWGAAVQSIVPSTKDAKLFLLELDPTEAPPSIAVKPYAGDQREQASEDYLAAEKRIVGTDRQVVLVSVDSVAALRRAYPNYYLDTRAFLRELHRVCGVALTGLPTEDT